MSGELPEGMTGVELERWIAILTTPGARGYPGQCRTAKCDRPRCSDGLCMTCLLRRGGSRGIRNGNGK